MKQFLAVLLTIFLVTSCTVNPKYVSRENADRLNRWTVEERFVPASIEQPRSDSNEADTQPVLPHAPDRYDVAVVIGNAQYTHISSVDYAINDASSVKDALTSIMGYDADNIVYYENATLSDFNILFGTHVDPSGKLMDFVRHGESNVFIYFAGHGLPSIKEKGRAYFVPVDADPIYIEKSGYSMQLFRNNIAQIPAKSLTVVVDACFSGMSASGDLLLPNVSGLAGLVRTELPFDMEGAVFMTSSRPEQVATWYPAKRHSTFTYWWLNGLQGAADSNADREVTVGELRVYLEEQVSYTARREAGQIQTPVISGDDGRVMARLP